MKKMYCYYVWSKTSRIESANIAKETNQMYILETELWCKKRYYKSESGKFDGAKFVAIAESKQEFVEMVKKGLQRKIELYQNEIKRTEIQISNLDKEVE